AAPGAADEELGHAIVDRRAAGLGPAARNDGESHQVVATQDDEGVHRGVPEPARQLVGRAVTDFSERSRAEHAGVQWREVIQVVAVDAFDPLAVAGGAARIPHTDSHASPRKTKPGRPDKSCRPGPSL